MYFCKEVLLIGGETIQAKGDDDNWLVCTRKPGWDSVKIWDGAKMWLATITNVVKFSDFYESEPDHRMNWDYYQQIKNPTTSRLKIKQ